MVPRNKAGCMALMNSCEYLAAGIIQTMHIMHIMHNMHVMQITNVTLILTIAKNLSYVIEHHADSTV